MNSALLEAQKIETNLPIESSNHSYGSSKAQKILPQSFVNKMKEWNAALIQNSKLDKDILLHRDREIFKFFGFDPSIADEFSIHSKQPRIHFKT